MTIDIFDLPRGSLTCIHYPILRSQKGHIETILEYALRVRIELANYNEAKNERIDINMDEVNKYIQLCRDVCEALGTTEHVPFDILIELRKIQIELQHVVYLYRMEGRQRIGPVGHQTVEENM